MVWQQVQRHPLVKRFNQFDTRQRMLIIGAWLLVFWVLLDAVLVTPLQDEAQALQLDTAELQSLVTVFVNEKNKLQQQATQKVVKTPEQELAELEARLTELNLRLKRRTNNLVEPTQMVELLREVFIQQTRVSLLDVESLKPEPIVTRQVEDKAADPVVAQADSKAKETKLTAEKVPPPDYYKHVVRLTFDGSFRDITRYLDQVEKLPWQLYWGAMTLEVKEFPRSRVILDVYTLSKDKAWLGV